MGALYVSCLIVAACGAFIDAKVRRFDRMMDMFNEVKLIVIMYHMMCFSSLVPDPVDQYNIGYSCAIALVLGTSVNFFQLVVPPFVHFKRWLYIRKSYKKSVIAAKQRKSEKAAKEFHARRLRDRKSETEEQDYWFAKYERFIELKRMRQK